LNKKIAILMITIVTVLMLATPVFAVPPTRGTFSQVVVEVNVSPGTSFMTGDVEHAKGSTNAAYIYGAPWGNSIPESGSITTTSKFSHVTGIGYTVSKTYATYATGMVVGTVNAKLLGFGPYTYTGPTFSFSLPGGISGTFTHGVTYGGLLLEGIGVKHGVSGDLKGLETKETFTGVFFLGGPFAGLSLVDHTGTYKLPG
jgi:hypothetical protein